MLLISLASAGFLLAALMPIFAKYAPRGLGFLAALLPAAVLIATLPVAPGVIAGEPFTETLVWVEALGLSLSLYLDGLALLFVWLICGIGVAVFLHAGDYMAEDPKAGRFFTYLLLFATAMLGLVLSGNLMSLFVFWELTSVTSYLLIGYKTESAESRAAALRALLVTAGGGLAMLAGLILLGAAGGSLEIAELLNSGDQIRAHGHYSAIAVLIIIGAVTKSAQAPFHFWLPGAMAAPTPVSAFLHSATMVKAGVFLLARLNPVLGGTDLWLWPLVVLGAVTMLMGAARAPFKTDLKQMLAYSTISVLGMLVMLLGLGHDKAIKAALVVLVAHALYKGSLFLAAGTIDHATGTRDITRLRGLGGPLRMLFVAGAIAALSMIGLPPLAGFLAKETLLEAVLSADAATSILMVTVVLAGIGLMVTAWLAGVKPFLGANGEVAHRPTVMLWLGPLIPAAVGLLLGQAPGLMGPLIETAAAEVAGEVFPVKLALWHGLTPALGLSAAILGLGALMIATHGPLSRRVAAIPRVDGLRTRAIFDAGFDALMRLAARVESLLDGRSPSYGLSIILWSFLILGVVVSVRLGAVPAPELTRVDWVEIGIGVLILGATAVVLLARSMLAAAASLGAVGFGIAMVFFLYGAVDLAITQFLVETLMVLLFVLVVYAFPDFKRLSTTGGAARDLVIAGALGAFITLVVWKTGAIQLQPPISEYHVVTAVPEAYGRNIVNVTLVDFRALDTLGEITVLLIAALGVTALIKRKERKTS